MIRLYRFYNLAHEQYGEPFAMCDVHKLGYTPPSTCIFEKVADEAAMDCNLCEQAKERLLDEDGEPEGKPV